MDKQRKNIKLLIDNLLIGSLTTDNIETYRVTTENIIDFIASNFILKRQGMDNIIKLNEKDK